MRTLRVLFLLVLAVTATGLSVWHFTNASPSPSVNRVVTPGAIGPCTWFISLDGTTPVAEAMVGGLSVSPGDNVVGSVGQDAFAFMSSLGIGANPTICFQPGTTFNIGSAWTVGTNLRVDAYGAIFKWTASTPANNLAMVDNSAQITVSWSGGTFDENNVAKIFWGYGSTIGSNPANPIVNSYIRDLSVINCIQDCVLINNVNNNNLYVTNLRAVKSASGTIADVIEIDGQNIWFQAWVNMNFAASSAITSASLTNATIFSYVVKSLDSTANPDVNLQAFTGFAGTFPFQADTIYLYNGGITLTNGNLASGAVAGQNIWIHGSQGVFFYVGTNGGSANGGGEIWNNIQIDGQWIPNTPSLLNSFKGVMLTNMEINATALGTANGLVYTTATNAMDRPNDNLVVNNLIITNMPSTASFYFWAQNSGNNKLTNFTMTGGSIAQKNMVLPSKVTSSGVGTTTLAISNVLGLDITGTILSRNDITGQTMLQNGVCSYTPALTGTYLIGGYIVGNSGSASPAVSFTVTWTDEASTVHTAQSTILLITGGASANSLTTFPGYANVLSFTIRAKAGTQISTNNGIGGTVNYDSGCWIQNMSGTY